MTPSPPKHPGLFRRGSALNLDPIWSPLSRWLLAALIAAAALYGMAIIVNQSAQLDGQRAFWLHDDMMISMQYARNLARGQGLVWSPGGPRVEGYSNFGWVLILALVHRLPLAPLSTSLAVLLINLALAGLALALTTRLIEQLQPEPGLALPAALLTLLLARDLARWATIGMETTLLTVGFLGLVLRVLGEARDQRIRPLTFVLAGALGLVRADGLLYTGMLVLLAAALQQDRRRLLLLGPLALLLPLAHLAFRMAYYGVPFPNTYYLKLTGWDWPARAAAGLRYAAGFLRSYGPAWLAAGLGAWASRDRTARALALLGLAPLGYVIYTGGDDFSGARFFAPWLPALIGLAFLAPARFGWDRRPALQLLALGGLSAVTLLGTGYNFWRGPGDEARLLRLGLALEESTGPEARIGTFWAGTVIYFADRPGVDLLGKNDPVIARQPAYPGSRKPGHNKFDYDYSLGLLAPDLVIAPLAPAVVSDPAQLARFAAGDHAYSGQLFLSESFQRNYAPTLVWIAGLPVFVSSDSPERARWLDSSCEPITAPALRQLGFDRSCGMAAFAPP